MRNLLKLNGLLLVLVLGVAAGSAVAAFSNNMTLAQLQSEVTSRLATQSVLQIAQAAKAAGVSAADITKALINAGQDPAVAVAAAIRIYGPDSTQAVVDAALSIPGVNRAAVLAAAGQSGYGAGSTAALAELGNGPPLGTGAGGGGGGGVASPH